MRSGKKNNSSFKALILAALALLICLAAGIGSVAYLNKQSGSVTNLFKAAIKYTLNYDLNGGTGSVPEDVFVTDAIETSHTFIVTSAEPTNEAGDTFLGWANDADATEAAYKAGDEVQVTILSPNKTLYAVWESGEVFKLNFDANIPEGVNASVTVPPALTAPATDTVHTFNFNYTLTDANNADTGLVFLGWSLTKDGAVDYPVDPAAPGFSVTVTEKETTLYAVWGYEYYLAFDRGISDGSVGKYTRADGTLVNTDAEDRIVLRMDDSDISVFALYESGAYMYKRGGYMLVGFSAVSGEKTPLEKVELTQPGINNAKVVYAIWTEGSYALIYDANGGSNAPAAQTVTEAVTSYTFDISTEVPTPLAGANAEFMGWARTPDAEKPEFVWKDGAVTPASVTLDESDPSLTLYAVWNYTYRLSFNAGYGDPDSPVPETMTVVSTKKTCDFTIPREPVPTRLGNGTSIENADYEFHYWGLGLDRVNGEKRYCDIANYNDKITLHASQPDTTLYARFRPREGYYLTYDANGGTNAPSGDFQQTTDILGVFTISNVKPTRDAYEFVGWADDKADAQEAKYQPGEKIEINSDLSNRKTLYAVWKPQNRFAVKIDYAGGGYKHTYTVSNGCGGSTEKTDEFTGYSKSSGYVSADKTTYTFSSIGGKGTYFLGPPTKTGYIFRGFSDGVSIIPENAIVTEKDSNGTTYCTIKNVTVDPESEQTITVTDLSNGGKQYTLTITAVWQLKDTKDIFRLRLMPNYDYFKEMTLKEYSLEYDATDNQEEAVFQNKGLPSQMGYKVVGYSYSPDATVPDFAADSVTVSKNDTHVVVTTQPNKLDSEYEDYVYTLTLYAIWEKQHVYTVKLDYNGGKAAIISNIGNTLLTSTSYWYSESTSKTGEIEPGSYSFNGIPKHTYSYKNIFGQQTDIIYPTLAKNTLLGYAYAKDASTPDFPLSRINTGSITDTVTVLREDPDPGHDVVTTDYNTDGIQQTTLTLYAVWEKMHTFELQIDYNRTPDSTTAVTELADERPNVTSHTFTGPSSTSDGQDWKAPGRYGYKFLGYAYTRDATEPVYTPDANGKYSITIEEDGEHVNTEIRNGYEYHTMTLYAVWELEQMFKLDLDGNYDGAATYGLSKREPVDRDSCTWSAVGASTSWSRPGMKFMGYAYSPTATEPDFPADENRETEITLSKTDTDPAHEITKTKDGDVEITTLKLYAVWKETRGFNVSFDFNGGSYKTSSGSTQTAPYTSVTSWQPLGTSEYTFGSVYYVTNSSTPAERANYKFLGFSYSKDATTAEFPVTYKYESSQYRQYVQNVTVNTENAVSSTDGNGIETLTTTLYAVWQPLRTYKLIVDFDGGTHNGSTEQIVKTDTSLSADTETCNFALQYDTGSKSAPAEKTGYVFKGFAYTSNSNTVDVTVTTTYSSSSAKYEHRATVPMTADETNTVVDENGYQTTTVTIYPVWAVELRYNAGNGTGAPATQTILSPDVNGREFTIPAVRPSYQSFTFAGWTTSQGGAVPEYGAEGYYTLQSGAAALPSVYTMPDNEGTHTLHAVWRQDYRLQYSANGGVEDETPDFQSITGVAGKGATFNIGSKEPTYEGHTFLGWSTDPAATEPTYRFGSSTYQDYIFVTGNTDGTLTVTTLYAVWQENSNDSTQASDNVEDDESTITPADEPAPLPSSPTDEVKLDVSNLTGVHILEAQEQDTWDSSKDMLLTLVADEEYTIPAQVSVEISGTTYVFPAQDDTELPTGLEYDAATGKITIPVSLLTDADTVKLYATGIQQSINDQTEAQATAAAAQTTADDGAENVPEASDELDEASVGNTPAASEEPVESAAGDIPAAEEEQAADSGPTDKTDIEDNAAQVAEF